MEVCPRLDDADALLQRRGEGPWRGNHMRVREIFEHQVPCVRLRIPQRVETPRHETGRHERRDLGIKRHLLAPGMPWCASTHREAGLEDDRGRGLTGCAIVEQAQPD